MTELIEDLLTLARTDSGGVMVRLERMQITSFLHDCIDNWIPLMETSRLQTQLETPDTETTVLAEPRLLRRRLRVDCLVLRRVGHGDV